MYNVICRKQKSINGYEKKAGSLNKTSWNSILSHLWLQMIIFPFELSSSHASNLLILLKPTRYAESKSRDRLFDRDI